MKIPFLSFNETNRQIKPLIMARFEQFFDSGWYVLGKELSGFEAKYAAWSGSKHCIGVSNGLDALILSLRALGIGPGDKVIVPSNTYIASLLAVSYVGAEPVLCEPDEATFNLNPANLEACTSPEVKAVMPVHLYGQACRMDEICAFADRYNLAIVEDNAQSQGAEYQGNKTGSFGQINGVSFYPGKNLGALGEAGGITTDDDDLAEKVRALRNYGSEKKYYNKYKGVNARLDEWQAAVLDVKLDFLEEWTADRRRIAGTYDRLLAGAGDLILPKTAPGATHVWHLYVIRTEFRDELQAFLAENEIGSLIHYPVPPHLQEAYAEADWQIGQFPIAEKMAKTCLSLPLFPGLSEEDIAEVAGKIKLFFEGKK